MLPNKRISTLSSLLLFLIISVAGYFTIRDLVGLQSQQHQQSVSPIFALIETELVEPLHIVKTLDKVGVYKEYFDTNTPNTEALIERLAYYDALFDLEFYVAHEKSRKQYNSDGRVFDLLEGKVIWYFALKNETNSEIQAVLGKREDVHLYIDVRQYDEEGKFIGFVGVGKSLQDFIRSFERYKSQYGHEFLFVNNRDEIVLSSRQDLQPRSTANKDDNISMQSIHDLPWYQYFINNVKDQAEPSVIVDTAQGELLVSQLQLESLQWSLYLLTPLSERQQAVSQSFLIYISIAVAILFVIYMLLTHVIEFYIDKMSRKINYDPHTNLANRQYAKFYFARNQRRTKSMAVALINLDYFSQINENYGHNGGDQVLKVIAESLVATVGLENLVVRWSGEEFVLIIPGVNKQDATTIAENCLKAIVEQKIIVSSSFINVTASIGLAHTRNTAIHFQLLIEWADKAMRKAKQDGRNKIEVR